jgi:D-serine deaminase-like pyridoxal phosphate-dependent protein
MTASRRRFLKSVAAGSTAYLAGCTTTTSTTIVDAACPIATAPRPPALDYPSASYFGQISADLDAAGIGVPAVFLDMDRADANIAAIRAGIAAPLTWRIVEKSLPSLDLLSHVSTVGTTNAFLVLHLPLLDALLATMPTAEVMVGKTHLTTAVHGFFTRQPTGTDLGALAARVVFLADSAARLAELDAAAAALGVTLRVAVEIDVGLRRSGLRDPADLPAMLRSFAPLAAAAHVRFAGFLGYDGHVAHAPAGTAAAVHDAWAAATAEYQSFVDVLMQPEFAPLASLPGLIFQSGGSSTYPMYGTGTPVNDVAAGGAVLRPGSYPDHVIAGLSPAIFIATPVLRQYDAPELPFFDATQSARVFNGRQGLTIYGGGWPALYTFPADIQPAPLVSDATDVSMVPNQGMVTAPASTPLRPGDWVYYHPRQSDALFQFETLYTVRGGRLTTTTMAPYPRRY